MRIIKTPSAITPRYADANSAGVDLYVDPACEYVISPGEVHVLSTGIKVEIPRNHFGVLFPRSSLYKRGLALSNSVRVIESSYRGEILIPVQNITNYDISINGTWGIRVPLVQLVVMPYKFEKIEVIEKSREFMVYCEEEEHND